jgi:hypothetical protein
MAQNDPWAQFRTGGAPAAAPAADPIIKRADPYRAEDQQFQRDAAARAANTEARQAENDAFSRQDKTFNNKGKLRDDWNKLPEVKSYRVAVQQLAQALDTGDGPQADLALTYAFAKAMDPDSVVREAEQGMVANSQPWFQAAVEATKKQFGMDGAGSYTPEARAAIRQQIINSVANRRKLYSQQRGFFEDLAKRNGFDPYEVVGKDDGQPYFDRFAEYDKQQKGDQQDPAMVGGEDPGITGSVTDETPWPEDPNKIKVTRLADQIDKTEGPLGAFDLARQGLTFNLGDEAAGVGGAIGALLTGNNPIDAYNLENQAYDLRLERARRNTGALGTAAEFTGALASGGNALNAAPMTVRQAAGTGAGLGALYGFGSGEGFVGSTTNALLGAGFGGTVGGGVQMGANKVQSALASRQAAQGPVQARAAELADAATKENVNLNRAMVDPSLQNRVTGVDASMAGGPRLQAGMRQVEGQIEAGVQRLGAGGTAQNTVAQGQAIQNAGERAIKQSGKAVKAKYDAAVNAAGDTKVPPKESMAVVDEMIAKLGELPNENKAELAYLTGLKDDLSKNLSVGALRDLRTTLRKKISKGDLTFGQNEARVLDVMDAAANDIRAGLQAQGKGKAAKLFDVADKEYAGRMEFINGTLQKIIGKRGANLPPERVAANLAGMAKGKDSEGVRAFLGKLTPDELADVRASFADALGKNSKGDFSVAQFLTQSSERNFPENALRVVFGDEGAASIKRLRMLGEEVNRVTGAMNSRKSGTAVGNDYRSWLLNAVLGLLPGAAGGGTAGAIAGAATAMGVKATRDVLSARSLLSADISKWLASAPRTTSPQAINAHMARLSSIASGNSVARMDAKAIQEYLRAAITQSPGRAAAQQEDNGRVKPPQQ